MCAVGTKIGIWIDGIDQDVMWSHTNTAIKFLTERSTVYLEVCQPPYRSKLLLPFAFPSCHLPSSRQQPSQALCFWNTCAGEVTRLFPMASIRAHYLLCPVAFSIPADLGPDQWSSDLLTLLPSITFPPPTAILAATGLAPHPWFWNHLSLVQLNSSSTRFTWAHTWQASPALASLRKARLPHQTHNQRSPHAQIKSLKQKPPESPS